MLLLVKTTSAMKIMRIACIISRAQEHGPQMLLLLRQQQGCCTYVHAFSMDPNAPVVKTTTRVMYICARILHGPQMLLVIKITTRVMYIYACIQHTEN